MPVTPDKLPQVVFVAVDPARGIPACASCHQPGSLAYSLTAPPYAPYLTAQHADYIAKQLRDFREGRRENDATGKMAAIVKALSDTEIDSLGDYLASIPRRTAHAD
ncbi:MAG: c-type cytochrome [Rhodomicrobium sp.]|nr:c-type cytochrome [Rhodomicrobium sp.]